MRYKEVEVPGFDRLPDWIKIGVTDARVLGVKRQDSDWSRQCYRHWIERDSIDSEPSKDSEQKELD